MRWRSLLGCESAIAFGDVGGAIAFWMREGDRFDNEGFGGAIALLFPP
ncbi:MAG: hypothetical protein NTY89_18565 [Nostocales cyanobacterium LacPavin_0920_SED1_MAG_38_18]|nr:hypothetical protein [Nostocales cyanobacterium LacPavin_0920_SED1_MAG_38_18]